MGNVGFSCLRPNKWLYFSRNLKNLNLWPSSLDGVQMSKLAVSFFNFFLYGPINWHSCGTYKHSSKQYLKASLTYPTLTLTLHLNQTSWGEKYYGFAHQVGNKLSPFYIFFNLYYLKNCVHITSLISSSYNTLIFSSYKVQMTWLDFASFFFFFLYVFLQNSSLIKICFSFGVLHHYKVMRYIPINWLMTNIYLMS